MQLVRQWSARSTRATGSSDGRLRTLSARVCHGLLFYRLMQLAVHTANRLRDDCLVAAGADDEAAWAKAQKARDAVSRARRRNLLVMRAAALVVVVAAAA